jgi:hypothetical protein
MTIDEEKRMLKALSVGDTVRFKADSIIAGRKMEDHRLGMKVWTNGDIRNWDYSYLTCDAIESFKIITKENDS